MTEPGTPGVQRWWQLTLGVICMAMIANLQYGWTLFVTPIEDKYHWGLPAIQIAFTVFVLVETWLVPLEGYLVDRFGPKIVGVIAGVLVALAWVINAYANSLTLLYLGEMGGGLGALAGKVWRIGVMGYNAQATRVELFLAKLEQALLADGWRA